VKCGARGMAHKTPEFLVERNVGHERSPTPSAQASSKGAHGPWTSSMTAISASARELRGRAYDRSARRFGRPVGMPVAIAGATRCATPCGVPGHPPFVAVRITRRYAVPDKRQLALWALR
jgi:hypothetical protein